MGGRYSRPLYIVDGETGQLLLEQRYRTDSKFKEDFLQGTLKWAQFLHNESLPTTTPTMNNGGVIEYLDTNEIETSMIAMTAMNSRSMESSHKRLRLRLRLRQRQRQLWLLRLADLSFQLSFQLLPSMSGTRIVRFIQ